MLTLTARYFTDLGATFHDLGALYYVVPGEQQDALAASELGAVQAHLEDVLSLCRSLGMKSSPELIRARIDHQTLPRTYEGFTMLRDAVYAELRSAYFVYVPSDRLEYFEDGRWPATPRSERQGILSRAAQDAFPNVHQEMRSAGTCYAFGLPTAAIFHTMRGAEIGMRSLATDLGAIFPKPIQQMDWQPIINGISGKIRDFENMDVSKRPADHADALTFYSEAAAQLRFFKNAWRNRVNHVRATYADADAKEVIDHVRSFFETLKERLTEPLP